MGQSPTGSGSTSARWPRISPSAKPRRVSGLRSVPGFLKLLGQSFFVRGAMTSEAEDKQGLHQFGYAQELARRMHSFQNFAISFSIICILAGGINSFSQGLS